MTWSSLGVGVVDDDRVVRTARRRTRRPGFDDPDEAGDLAGGAVHLADDTVGSTDEPGAAVVGLGADGGAAVGVDRGDDHGRQRGDDEADDDHFT